MMPGSPIDVPSGGEVLTQGPPASPPPTRKPIDQLPVFMRVNQKINAAKFAKNRMQSEFNLSYGLDQVMADIASVEAEGTRLETEYNERMDRLRAMSVPVEDPSVKPLLGENLGGALYALFGGDPSDGTAFTAALAQLRQSKEHQGRVAQFQIDREMALRDIETVGRLREFNMATRTNLRGLRLNTILGRENAATDRAFASQQRVEDREFQREMTRLGLDHQRFMQDRGHTMDMEKLNASQAFQANQAELSRTFSREMSREGFAQSTAGQFLAMAAASTSPELAADYAEILKRFGLDLGPSGVAILEGMATRRQAERQQEIEFQQLALQGRLASSAASQTNRTGGYAYSDGAWQPLDPLGGGVSISPGGAGELPPVPGVGAPAISGDVGRGAPAAQPRQQASGRVRFPEFTGVPGLDPDVDGPPSPASFGPLMQAFKRIGTPPNLTDSFVKARNDVTARRAKVREAQVALENARRMASTPASVLGSGDPARQKASDQGALRAAEVAYRNAQDALSQSISALRQASGRIPGYSEWERDFKELSRKAIRLISQTVNDPNERKRRQQQIRDEYTRQTGQNDL